MDSFRLKLEDLEFAFISVNTWDPGLGFGLGSGRFHSRGLSGFLVSFGSSSLLPQHLISASRAAASCSAFSEASLATATFAASDLSFSCFAFSSTHVTPKTTRSVAAPHLTLQTAREADSPLVCVLGTCSPKHGRNRRQAAELCRTQLKKKTPKDVP